MPKIFILLISSLLLACQTETTPTTVELPAKLAIDSLTQHPTPEPNFQNGDIIFHSSNSAQSKAIQLATNSPYSHVGIIYIENEQVQVFEAVQPVKLTPIKDWINRGEGGHYVVKRLKNAATILTEEALQKMKDVGTPYLGKNYDIYFNWSDDKIYCSELVWKIYKKALNVELGKLQKFGDFNLSLPIVQQKLKERYGDKIPLEEPIISPAAIFASEELLTVMEN